MSNESSDYKHATDGFFQQGIIAGAPFVDEVFSQLGCTYVYNSYFYILLTFYPAIQSITNTN